MHNNLLLLPIIIPFFAAMVLLFAPKNVLYQRIVTMIALIAATVSAFYMLGVVYTEGPQTVTFGNWPAPFGITMVSDMMSILLVVTTLVLTLFIVWYSFFAIGVEREKFYYYPGIMFILTGINGAFTTGDIFNLFVFFEVFLMSSYLLIVLGGEKKQLQGSIYYLVINIISSALFVITVAFLYSVVGTLSMADIAVKVAELQQPAILTVIAILFLIVFGLKAAIFPLFFWLPKAYQSAPTPILALFGALLTKVGVYAIMRTYTLIFVHDTSFTHELLMVLSILTIVFGCIGALAYFDVTLIIIYNIVIAVGVILFGVSQMNTVGLEGAMYYLVHDMLIKAALFMLGGIIVAVSGTANLRQMGGLIKRYPLLGWTFFIAALSLAGIPPLSGFIGKLLIVEAGFAANNPWMSIVILLSSLIVLLSMMRIFIYAFWGEEKETATTITSTTYAQQLTPAVLLVCVTIAYGVGAEAVAPYMAAASEALMQPQIYIQAVLGGK